MSPYVNFLMRQSGQPLSDFGENCITALDAIARIENYQFLESFNVVINIADSPKPGRSVLDAIKRREVALMENVEKKTSLREDILANPNVFIAKYEFPINVPLQEQINRMFDLTKKEEEEEIIDVILSKLKYIPSKEWKHASFANLSAELYIWQSAHGYPDYSGHQPLWINEKFEIEEGSSTYTAIRYNFPENASITIPCILKVSAMTSTGQQPG